MNKHTLSYRFLNGNVHGCVFAKNRPVSLIYRGHIHWLDTADLFDHCPVIALQVQLGQWPSFNGMEHGPPHARAVYMATGLVREVAGCENW